MRYPLTSPEKLPFQGFSTVPHFLISYEPTESQARWDGRWGGVGRVGGGGGGWGGGARGGMFWVEALPEH